MILRFTVAYTPDQTFKRPSWFGTTYKTIGAVRRKCRIASRGRRHLGYFDQKTISQERSTCP